MSNIPKDLRFTKDHEYARKTDTPGVVQVGITDYAQGELGDVVYVDLPKLGAVLEQKGVFGTIEAVKAVSELYSPLAGTVVEVNAALEKDPAVVNRDPYGAGGRIKLKMKNAPDLDVLLGADAYKQHIGE